MEERYYKDNKHNYLVMEAGKEALEGYQFKMLLNNSIPGILNMDIRHMDNETYLYYQIDSKMSIANKYAENKMGYDSLMLFLESYVSTCKRLGDYLLDEECLVINKDCIFEEYFTGKFFFIYNPDVAFDTCSLTDMLMELTDIADEKASALVYRICDAYNENNTILSMIIDDILCMEKKDEILKSFQEDEKEDNEEEDVFEDDEDAEEIIENRIIRIRFPGRLSLILGGLFLVVAGALWYIRIFYNLTYEESLLDMGTLMASIFMALVCFLQGFKCGIINENS